MSAEDLDGFERRLARADFSADSRVRATLRARLVAGARPSPLRRAPLALALAAAGFLLLSPIPRQETDAPAAAPAPAASSGPYPRGGLGLPMLPGRLPARAVEPPPIARGAARVVEGADRRTIVWELEGATYALETRTITHKDIFARPAL